MVYATAFYAENYAGLNKLLPRMTPTDKRMMNGRLLPSVDLQRSETDPRIGVQKNPTNGERHQIRVMCLWRTPVRRCQDHRDRCRDTQT